MNSIERDAEYAISFIGSNGLDELSVGDNATLAEARKTARWYHQQGCKQITIKFYEEGDLRHQWDFDGRKFTQYE